jgi:hypothetical protein
VARPGTPSGFAFLSVALLLMSGCGTDVASQEGMLTRAAEAKRQGRSSTTVTAILDENGTGSSLPEIIKSSSIVVVQPGHAGAAQTIGPDWILTWHVLRVTDTLSARASADREACGQTTLPKDLRLGPQQIAVPLTVGTALINGVSVTMETSHELVQFKPDRSYLLLGHRCPSGVFLLPRGELDVFDVTPTGELQFSVAEIRFPFTKELLETGNVDALRTRIRDMGLVQR